MSTILRVGDRVLWRGAWGHSEPQLARVARIEIVEPGQKEGGVPVDAVPWSAVERDVVVDLDNGHWAYGRQLRPVREEIMMYEHASCPATTTDECHMMRERKAAGRTNHITACPVHGAEP